MSQASSYNGVFADSAGAYEISDCQRLVVSESEELLFGPLVAVSPSPYFKGSSDAEGDWKPVALVINYDTTPVEYLAIEASQAPGVPWVQCLWMRLVAGGWDAHLAKGKRLPALGELLPPPDPTMSAEMQEYAVRLQGKLCESEPEAADPPNLVVKAQTLRGARPSDYPQTARWMWEGEIDKVESSRGRQYIGLGCNDAWCAVADAKTADLLPNELEGDGQNPGRYIPGWFDEQFLPVHRNGAWRPGPWASVWPVEFDTTATLLQPVAVVRLREGVPGAGDLGQKPTDHGPEDYEGRLHLKHDGRLLRPDDWETRLQMVALEEYDTILVHDTLLVHDSTTHTDTVAVLQRSIPIARKVPYGHFDRDDDLRSPGRRDQDGSRITVGDRRPVRFGVPHSARHGPTFSARWRWPTVAANGMRVPLGVDEDREAARAEILSGIWVSCRWGCCDVVF